MIILRGAHCNSVQGCPKNMVIKKRNKNRLLFFMTHDMTDFTTLGLFKMWFTVLIISKFKFHTLNSRMNVS